MANKLVLEVVADASGFLLTMDAAQQAVDKFIKGASDAGESLGGGVNKALDIMSGLAGGGTLALGVLAGAFVGVVTGAAAFAITAGTQAEELKKLSETTGINTDTLQVYGVLLSRVGLDGNAMAQVMRTLSNQMEQARLGTGLAADRFKQLGIDITTVTSTDDLIRRIIGSVGNFADGTGKAAVMGQLLGRNWTQVMAGLQGGTDALNKATIASASLGTTLGGTQLTALLATNTAMADMNTAWTRFSQQLGATVAPAVTMIVNGFTALLAGWSRFFHDIDLGLDVVAIKLTHLWLQMGELASMDFSGWFVAGPAWEKTLANLKQIDDESAKLIAARMKLDLMPPPPDVRPNVPQIVDSQKAMTEARALADSLLKYDEDLYKNKAALQAADLATYLAYLNTKKGYSLEGDAAIASQSSAAEASAGISTVLSLQTQASDYLKYFDIKRNLYLGDTKSQAEKAKFEVDASAKYLQLLNQEEVAQAMNDALGMTSARAVSDARLKLMLQPYDDEIAKLTAVDAAQQALFHDEAGMLGASDAARQVRMTLIDAESAKELLVLQQTLGRVAEKAQAQSAAASGDQTLRDTALAAETRLQQAIQNLDTQTDTKRRQALQQFPTFFESQMQTIISSSAFSMGSMVSTWSGGIANMVVMVGNLKAAWQQTQVAIVQAVINAGVQQVAISAIAFSRYIGLLGLQTKASEGADAEVLVGHTILETAKTKVSALADSVRTVASLLATKTMGEAGVAAIGASGMAMVGVMQAVVDMIAATFEAMAAALAASVVGSEFAPGMLEAGAVAAFAGNAATDAGAIAVGAATTGGTAGNIALSAGGIGSFGSGTPATLHGQEAIIPLNDYGASFMRDLLGLGNGGGGATTIVVQLDGREIARSVLKYMPGIVYMRTGLA